MSLLHRPRVRRLLDRWFLNAVPTCTNCVALTFDDGPNPRNTPPLLDLLERKGIVATFFLIGRHVRRHPELARDIHARGHEIANHTDQHMPLPLLPRRFVDQQIRRAERAIVEATGSRPRFLRPPMGWFSARVLDQIGEAGYVPVIGSVHPRDSRQPRVETIVERVRPRIDDGAIVILHDGGWHARVDRSNTIEAVDRLTDEWLAEGRQLVTLSAMTGRDDVPTPPRNGPATPDRD